MSVAATDGDSASAKRYGMTVDVNRCVGCQTCTIACKHANDTTPGVQWRSVLDVEQGAFPDVRRFFLVVGCQHCAEPPCVPVCPTGATAQRADGLVTMDHDLCIGCAYCAVACPYQARTIVHEDTHYFKSKTRQEAETSHPERIGTIQKCTFCIDRVDEGQRRGLVPGEDLDVTPACASSCIAQAIKFGDFNDPDSEVSSLARDRQSFQINDFLGTDPQIKYLYEVEGAIPEQSGPQESAGVLDDAERDPSNPLNGPLQTFWDYRAAMNFIMGGMGSGLIAISGLSAIDGQIPANVLPMMFSVGGAIVAIGLIFVFMEIGRKERFMYALLRPQSSWMTREVWVVGMLFPLIAANLFWSMPWLWIATSMAGLAFLFCQAQILYAGKGIPAWRAPLVPALLVATGLTEGAGVAMLVLAGLGHETIPKSLLLLASLLAIVTAVFWLVYRHRAKDNGIPARGRDALGAIHAIVCSWWTVAIVIMLACLAIAPLPAYAAFCAALLIGAGALWKYTVIVRASYQQGFVLPKRPGRGSGKYAAPARLDGYKRAA
ncbi:MAG: 4Fe-4S dicluster domain-containing protein [Hyphomicrobiaceae bacterium]